jgi:hemoglobin
MMDKSMYELAGGEQGLHALASAFYRRVLSDRVMLPLFADPDEDHAGRMAIWLIEELGGPPLHTLQRGGRPKMLEMHESRKFSIAQREHWVTHMLAACEEVNMSEEFMALFEPHIQFHAEMARLFSWGLA